MPYLVSVTVFKTTCFPANKGLSSLYALDRDTFIRQGVRFAVLSPFCEVSLTDGTFPFHSVHLLLLPSPLGQIHEAFALIS